MFFAFHKLKIKQETLPSTFIFVGGFLFMFKEKEILKEIKTTNDKLQFVIRKLDSLILITKNNKAKCAFKNEKGGDK